MAEAALNLGTLTVQLAADVSALKKEFDKAFRETQKLAEEAKSLRKSFDAAFGGVSTAASRVAGNLNQIAESIAKVFGENGIPQAREFANSLGLSDGKIKGLETSLKGLSGVFSVVSVAAGAISVPLLAAIAAVAGLILLGGALKLAWQENLGGIREIAADTWEFVTDALNTAAEFWIDAFNGVKDSILSALSSVMSYASKVAGALSSVIGDGASKWLSRASASIAPSKSRSGKEVLADLRSAAPGIIEDVKNVAVDGFKTAFDNIKQSWNELGGPLLKDLMGRVMDAIPESNEAAQKRLLERWKLADKAMREEAEARKRYADEVEKAALRELDARDSFSDALARQTERAYSTTSNRIGGVSVAGAGHATTLSEAELDRIYAQRGLGGYATDQFKSAASQGQYSGAAIQGASQGSQYGPWGAVIGALIGLLTQSQGFQKVVESLNGVLGSLSEWLGNSIAPLSNVLSVVGEIITPILEALEPSLWSAAIVFNAVAAVLKLLVSAVNWVIYGIKTVTNKIFDAIANVVDHIPGLGKFADWLRDQKMDAESSRQAAQQAWDDFKNAWGTDLFKYKTAADPVADLGNAASTAAGQMREFSESLTNLPSGYKIALARFNATTALGELQGAGATTNNVTINIQSSDPDAQWRQIKRRMQRDGYLEPAAAPVSG